MRHLRLLVLVGGMLIGAGRADAGDNPLAQSEYFPLSLGSRWVYSVYVSIADTVIRLDTIGVDDVVEIDGETFYHITTPWFGIYSVWIHPNSIGDLYWTDSPGEVEHPLLLFSDVGWNGWVLGGRHCADSVTRIACNLPIVTPVGAFDNAVCLASEWREGDCDAYWFGAFARGVGPAIWKDIGSAGASIEWTLMETYVAPTTSCKCHGDPVCDGILDIRDVVKTIDVAFRGAPPELDRGCSWFAHQIAGRSDVDCSGATDIIDVIWLIDFALREANPTARLGNPCP